MLLIMIILLCAALLACMIGIANKYDYGLYYLFIIILIGIAICVACNCSAAQKKNPVLVLKCEHCNCEGSTKENTFEYDWSKVEDENGNSTVGE